MRIIIDSCAYPEYVYQVPIFNEVQCLRYRTEAQKIIDAYLDAIIPDSFKRPTPLAFPANSCVDVGWDRETNKDEGTFKIKVWLKPNEYTEAKEPKLILDVIFSEFADHKAIIKDMLMRKLRHRK